MEHLSSRRNVSSTDRVVMYRAEKMRKSMGNGSYGTGLTREHISQGVGRGDDSSRPKFQEQSPTHRGNKERVSMLIDHLSNTFCISAES